VDPATVTCPSPAPGTSGSSGTTGSSGCAGYALPDESAGCACPSGHSCTANHCYGGWYCDLATTKCVDPAKVSCGAGTSSSTGTSGTSGTSGGTTGSGSGVGPQGGSVTLLHFGVSGDTRPPSCEDTAGYPTSVINGIADAERAAGAQFAVDMGDHMYVCNNDASIAQQQMGLFMEGVARFGGTWFLTEGNHECMGAGSGSCPTGSTNVNYQAFLSALSPISSTPYYSVDIQTSLGLATLVVVADNSWDAAQQSWLEQTLARADAHARYTIIAKHHPEGDTSVAANTTIMQVIRAHKFALLLTGHAHRYEHQTTDQGRDVIIGNGGAPLVSGGTFFGYAMVDQQPDGTLKLTMYDLATTTPHDSWTVGPNP
jgi:hypothetical protein